MKLLLPIALIFFSCMNPTEKKTQQLPTKTSYLDSIMAESKMAFILFHHQIQKTSVIAKQYQNRQEIDSIFAYIGEVSNDTSCLQGGLFNYFGQINLCKDSSISDPIAKLHFVIEENCEGFYLQTDNYLKRYALTVAGKKFLLKQYEPFKKRLK
jgi:hypothetical protein